LKEAGGFIDSIYSGGNMLKDGTVIGSNDQIFSQFSKAIRKNT
jgi:hypothetical protein